jgi:hypothetical protein
MTLLAEVCVLEVPLEALFYWGGGLKTRIESPSRTPQARVERRRRETVAEIFKFRVSEMPFPGLWGRFERILMVRKQRYSMSKITICLEFSSIY